MGINPNTLRYLAREKKRGNPLGRTATIGRQGVHMDPRQVIKILNVEFALALPEDQILAAYSSGFADDLLKLLGAQSVESFDYSDYEGANHLHDFNTPIHNEHKGKYSFLIDGGTLEHVFQFPTALKNCMEMLAVGGVYFGNSPANNEMGHGFYQFSPELYFRSFSKENGFRIEELFLYEGRESKFWYRLTDPNIARRRVEKIGTKSAYILVKATRVSNADIFANPPLQPDYVSAWCSPTDESEKDGRNSAPETEAKPLWRRLGSPLPKPVKWIITMTMVKTRALVIRLKIHMGLNPDPEIFEKINPAKE